MTVKYSLDWKQKLKPKSNESCRACGLYLNQPPVHQNANVAQIFWVGLSAVRFDEGAVKLPLAPSTNSGALIQKIEEPLKNNFSIYKTNLVKCLPLNGSKIRYPSKQEMKRCYGNFKDEIAILKPSIIFLLGKQVSSFVLSQHGIKNFSFDKNYNYSGVYLQEILYVPIHHPSYVLIYKRKQLDNYIKGLRKVCEGLNIKS